MSVHKSPHDYLRTIEVGLKVSYFMTGIAIVLWVVFLFAEWSIARELTFVYLFGGWMYRRGVKQTMRYADSLHAQTKLAWRVTAGQEYQRGYYKGAEHQRVADLLARESRQRANEYAAEQESKRAPVQAHIERRALPSATED